MLTLLTCAFVLCLIYHSYTDFEEMLLYDWNNLILAVLGLIFAYLNHNVSDALFGFAFALMVLLIIYFASKGGLGEGDVKLAPCLALWLGFEGTIVALLLAFTLGAIIGLTYMLLQNKQIKTAIPFGPFLCLGSLISFFFKTTIINFYWNFFI
ncbi:MAG: A24 family peptidase [Phascolarctobacterium sp.]|nr:A24 family peptidase [Phascolarctobacterium sp.]